MRDSTNIEQLINNAFSGKRTASDGLVLPSTKKQKQQTELKRTVVPGGSVPTAKRHMIHLNTLTAEAVVHAANKLALVKQSEEQQVLNHFKEALQSLVNKQTSRDSTYTCEPYMNIIKYAKQLTQLIAPLLEMLEFGLKIHEEEATLKASLAHQLLFRATVATIDNLDTSKMILADALPILNILKLPLASRGVALYTELKREHRWCNEYLLSKVQEELEGPLGSNSDVLRKIESFLMINTLGENTTDQLKGELAAKVCNTSSFFKTNYNDGGEDFAGFPPYVKGV